MSKIVPHELTEQNRKERVEKFKSNKWKLCDVVTGDECWFYHIGILVKNNQLKAGKLKAKIQKQSFEGSKQSSCF